MPFRLPASGQISFYELAVNGGNNGVENVTMGDLQAVYNVDSSDPDSINEFYGKCACYLYDIFNPDTNYDRYLSYQNCDGTWVYNESVGPQNGYAINAISNTVAFSGDLYNLDESPLCDS